MSEHDHEDEPQEVPEMIYVQLPPQIKAAIEHQKMHAESNAHDVTRFLDSLDEEQLKDLRGLIGIVSVSTDTASYFMGLVGGMLKVKFGFCLACGKKHDDELAKLVGDGPIDSVQRVVDAVNEPEPEKFQRGEKELQELYYLYNVEVDDDGPGIDGKLKVQCKGCGTWYVDLDDRMVKAPDNCDGCIQKAKWG